MSRFKSSVLNFTKNLYQINRTFKEVVFSLKKNASPGYVQRSLPVEFTPKVTDFSANELLGSITKEMMPSEKGLNELQFRRNYVSRRIKVKLELYGLDFLLDETAIGIIHKKMPIDHHCLALPWFWRVILKVSKSNHNIELKTRLRMSGISSGEFSCAVAKVYGSLNVDVFSCKRMPFEKSDVIDVLEDLRLNEVEFKSIRILLNMKGYEQLCF